MDFDNIFDAKQAEPTAQPVPEAAPPVDAVQAEETATPAVEAQIEAAAEPPAPEPAPQERGDKFVPLAAMLDERDKRKALEAKLAELEAARAPAEAPAIPDPYDDPAGFNAYMSDLTNRTALAVKFDLSEDMAIGQHGEEAVNAAKEWAASKAGQDPTFKHQFLTARNPIDWAVRQHKQAEDLELYKTDPVAFARRILEAQGQPVPDAVSAAVADAGQQPQAPRPAAPPRSIAGAPSGGNARAVASGPLSAVDAVFTR